MGVAPNGLVRMAEEGTAPPPFARMGNSPVWAESDVVSFFGTLQMSQSAYAPIDSELGQDELVNLEAYICPANSPGHIGNRRPAYLALYKTGAPRNAAGFYEVDVYPVEWVQTQHGVAGETIVAPADVDPATITPVPWSRVRPDRERKPRVLFKLDTGKGRSLQVQTGIRRGGTISTESLLDALDATPRAVSYFKGGRVHLSE